MQDFGMDRIRQNILQQQEKMGRQLAEGMAINRARQERDSANLEAIRVNTDHLVDNFYQSMVNLEILNNALDNIGLNIEELTDIKEFSAEIYDLLKEQEINSERERLDFVSRILKRDPGFPLAPTILEIISWAVDYHKSKSE